MTASRGRDWGGPVFDSPMLNLAKYFGYVLTSPQSERVLGWGVILEMPRIGFTRVREAWCRVPKSPRESREVTGVMFRKQVGEKKRLLLPWRSVRVWLGTVARWPVSPRLVGDYGYVASQSALGWGLWLGDEYVRAWLGTVARWPVSPRLVGDYGYMASQSALDWGLSRGGKSIRAWLGTVAMWRVASLSALGWGLSRGGQSVRAWLETVAMWRVSPRLIGDCREVAMALRPLPGESVRTWLGRLAIERCGPLPRRVSPRLVGDCLEVASQSALDWGLLLCVSQSALDWGLSLSGKSVRAWLGTVAMWRVSPRLIGDCHEVASQWFRWFYKPQIGERPTSPSIEWARALGCLQPASLPLRGSTVSRYELVVFFVFGFVCGG
ncbi:hypothetical protein ACLB2K_076996 [Fragaria x ananassa]